MDIFTRGDLTLPRRLTIVIAVLMAFASISGLLGQSYFYPTEELRNAFVPNDLVNLLIGLPALLGSMALAGRGRLLGLLLWPGALFFVMYNYIAYEVTAVLPGALVMDVGLIIFSAAALVHLMVLVNGIRVKQRLAGKVSERFVAGVLVGLGLLFFLRGAWQVALFLSGKIELSRPELGVLAADLLILPFWMVVGVSLWRRQAVGYVAAAGLLFQASMAFVGLLVFFIVQPFLMDAPFATVDFLVVLGLGVICFIPFGLFLRGVRSIPDNASPARAHPSRP